ncbi:FG-GAP-like repeat-containing protein [Streptomyces sp. JH14]|uniref:FG-GAP-like repeat-containing protein n=1 Tax=Streptomyces sp. JH14 TaxID=2793630 RepID=UPI0023F924A4|nr:FG-GAP-like repeat-containing protein [Streptomyces sp. JH14]MDF6043400.1 FG-GAP-like repeat-containing protein [Streptomyces sp. JH14]
MSHYTQPRRATVRRVLGSALVPVLGLGIAATGVHAAFAAPAARPAAAAAAVALDPWAASVPLTDGTTIQDVLDVKTAGNGAVVALWNRKPADKNRRELVAAVRPAGSTVWGAPQVLATTPTARGDAQIVTSTDGSVVASWTEYPNDTPPDGERLGGVFRMSVLAAGATTWSGPSDIAASDAIRDARLVGSPSGKLVAVWRDVAGDPSSFGLFSSVRPAPGAAWSHPAQIDVGTPGQPDVDNPQLVYADDGTATVAFGKTSPSYGHSVKVVDLAADSQDWSAPVTVFTAAPESGIYANGASLTLGRDGRAALVWTAYESAMLAQRPAGSRTWGAAEPITGVGVQPVRDLAVGPDGDITLLWGGRDAIGNLVVRATTRSAATGTWSAVKQLSSDHVLDDRIDLTVGADGTAHAVWRQEVPGDGPTYALYTASRVNGVWTTPVRLSTNTDGNSQGQVTVDAGNRPVAVWTQATMWAQDTRDATTQVRSATTAPAPPAPSKPLPKWRDFSGDGRGDLLGLTSGGSLAVRTGTSAGGFGTGVSAAGWPATSVVVPFGDLSGDRCNDVLVRNSSGVLTRYDGACGKAFAPSGPKRVIGSGWNIYNVLTSPGDLTGDGRADLLARTPAGELYLYADSGAGAFKTRVKVGGGWQIYNTIAGAGDLNGDKAGDLLARDAAGVLWRYDGTGKNTLKGRVKVGGGWQIYNAIAGAGDITGDGKADLVARDTAGVLWRYNGTGSGVFSARVKIGSGWQTYKSLL